MKISKVLLRMSVGELRNSPHVDLSGGLIRKDSIPLLLMAIDIGLNELCREVPVFIESGAVAVDGRMSYFLRNEIVHDGGRGVDYPIYEVLMAKHSIVGELPVNEQASLGSVWYSADGMLSVTEPLDRGLLHLVYSRGMKPIDYSDIEASMDYEIPDELVEYAVLYSAAYLHDLNMTEESQIKAQQFSARVAAEKVRLQNKFNWGYNLAGHNYGLRIKGLV